jgi:transcriptional regulator with XRE-family HTH domain
MQPVAFDTSRQLGAVVRSARERIGLSQRELAQQAGLERQWVVLLEGGRIGNPNFTNTLKVLAALGLRLQVAERPLQRTDTLDLDDLFT